MAAEEGGPGADSRGAGDDSGGDTVKVIATVMAKAPVMVIRIGWPVLKMRRQAKKCSRQVRKQLEAGGMPPHLATCMAERYASEMSIRELVQSLGVMSLRLR